MKDRRLVFDIETDGLLDVTDPKDRMSVIHCMAVADVDSDEKWFFGPDRIEDGIRQLQDASELIGHNIINFDLRAIEHVYPWFKRPKTITDTLIMVKMIWPVDVLEGPDLARWKKGQLPGQLIKRQGLEAWGYRLGVMKGDFSKNNDWQTYTEEMGQYNEQDVEVNLALWRLIEKRLVSEDYTWPREVFESEFRLKEILTEQEVFGWPFDFKGAVKLMAALKDANESLEVQLRDIFGEWWEAGPVTRPARDHQERLTWAEDITVKRFSPKTGKELKPYVGPPLCEWSSQASYTPVKRVTFNPSSRAHLGKRLQDLFGWKPLVFGGAKGDVAKVDETTLEEIPDAVLPPTVRELILNYFVVSKTLAALSKGAQSWMTAFRESSGCIHGQVDQNGTITSRATHSKPNIAQVPAVMVAEKKDENGKVLSKTPIHGIDGRFGWEARSLFRTRPGWILTGTDASSLELKCLGHHLAPFDGGKFAALMSDDTLDPHTENSKITGLSRSETKTVTYAFLYGAGPLKIGVGVGVADDEKEELLQSSELAGYLRFMRKTLGVNFQEPDDNTKAAIAKGQRVKAKFLAGIDGLKDYRQHTQKLAEKNGYLIGIDGRKIVVRKPHAAVNTQLQGDGAIICKQWVLQLHHALTWQHKLKHGRDFAQFGWIHDELQIGHEERLGELVGQTSQAAMYHVQKALGFEGVLKAEYKIGRTWAETH